VRFKEDSFWDSFGRALAADNKHVQLRSISNARDFADTLQDDSVFRDKQVVLIVDEFDKLYRATRGYGFHARRVTRHQANKAELPPTCTVASLPLKKKK